MDKNSIIASKIKEIRGQKGILQEHIAKGLGLSGNAYSRIEGGFTQLTINNLFKIAEMLETPIEMILSLKANNIAHNQSNVVMSQYNEGTVNIQLTPKEFTELYGLMNTKK